MDSSQQLFRWLLRAPYLMSRCNVVQGAGGEGVWRGIWLRRRRRFVGSDIFFVEACQRVVCGLGGQCGDGLWALGCASQSEEGIRGPWMAS